MVDPGVQLFGQMVAQGASAEKILRTLKLAIDNKYTPKGFTQDDHDDALLVRIIGGPRLLYAMHKAHGFESNSAYDKLDKRRFVSSWGPRVHRETVVENMDNFALRKPVPSSRVVHHLMVDDVSRTLSHLAPPHPTPPHSAPRSPIADQHRKETSRQPERQHHSRPRS